MTQRDNNLRLIEAILFASADALSVQDIYERVPQSADVAALLQQLQEEYADRGVHLLDIEGKWAFRTALDLADQLNQEKLVNKKLSRAAMEMLSIIAYHQPITRAEIENVRGVATHKGTLDTLMEMGWIKPGRRRETLGRPLTWVTTNGFLDHFSLESLMDLPGMDEMKASGLLDRRPAIDTVHQQDDLFDGGAVDGAAKMPTGQGDEEGVEEDLEHIEVEEESEG